MAHPNDRYTAVESTPESDLVAALSNVLGAKNVLTEEADRAFYANDVFSWSDVRPPDIVARPATTEEVSTVVRIASTLGYAILPRGGGMSYTKGYVTNAAKTVLVDTLRLNRIRTLDPVSRYVVVEAGCTWKQVAQETMQHAMLPNLLSTPMSGSHSTIGGGLSQNLPGTMAGVLSLEVVLPDGSIVRTGSWGRSGADPAPFYRGFGPDLTGLFLGDNGILGIKTAATLHLRKKPEGAAYASFGFDSYGAMAETMIELSSIDSIVARLGLCPHESKSAPQVAWKQGLKTLRDVAASGKTLFGGLSESMKMALAGRDFMADAGWTLHLKTEGVNDAAAESSMAIGRAIALKRATKELPPILLRAAEANGPSVRKFLGKDGERWVATNSMYPIAKGPEVARKVEAFFQARTAELAKHGVTVSYVSSCTPYHFMCEPVFAWPDSVTPLHLSALSTEEANRFKKNPANPQTRAYVERLREELRDFVYELGAVHVQFAKFYRYRDALAPTTGDLIAGIKTMLDPETIMSPGNLGFDPKPTRAAS